MGDNQMRCVRLVWLSILILATTHAWPSDVLARSAGSSGSAPIFTTMTHSARVATQGFGLIHPRGSGPP